MSYWKAGSSLGGWIGIFLIGIVLAVTALLLGLLVSRPLNLVTFLLGLLAAASAILLVVLVYWTHGYYSLYYTLDRDALRIRWAGFQTTIPISEIQDFDGEQMDRSVVSPPFLHWPGYFVGAGHVRGMDALYYATSSAEGALLIITDEAAYVISPEDPEGFTQALQLRQSLGAVHSVPSGVTASGLLRLPLWSDHLAQWLWLGALALNLFLTAYLCAVYPGLDPIVPVHFDPLGEVDRVAPAIVIFIVPIIGWVVLILNGLLGLWIHQKQRLAALLLWAGTVVIQVFLWLAALGITFHETIA